MQLVNRLLQLDASLIASACMPSHGCGIRAAAIRLGMTSAWLDGNVNYR